MRIAFQGEAGAYSEAAALKFRPDAATLANPAFEDVFHAVETGRAACGVLPIENSIGGTIHRNYDLLVQHELKIVGEVELQVIHCLAALPDTTFESLTQVYSHPQALAQCDRFLRSLQNVEIVATYDTAGSAKMIRDKQLKTTAAISSERAAEIFDLAVLKRAIQDHADNVTRFLVVTRSAAVADVLGDQQPNKTTVVFTLPNTPGSLFKALSVFALRDIDVTKVESRPIPGRPWEYLFYLDLAVGAHEFRCARALMHLAEFAPSMKSFGSYPSAQQVARIGGPAAASSPLSPAAQPGQDKAVQ